MSPSDRLFRLVAPHVDNLNRLLNTTISDSRLDSQTLSPNRNFHQVARRVGGQLAPIQLGIGRLEFSQVLTDLGRRAHVVEATYIYRRGDDWIFRYEYETDPDAGKPHSHLHVRGQHPTVGQLDKIHFPSGRLSVEHLIYHLITEFDEPSRLVGDELVRQLRKSFLGWQRTDRALFP